MPKMYQIIKKQIHQIKTSLDYNNVSLVLNNNSDLLSLKEFVILNQEIILKKI